MSNLFRSSPMFDSIETIPDEAWSHGPWSVHTWGDGWAVAHEGIVYVTFRSRLEAIRFAEGLVEVL